MIAVNFRYYTTKTHLSPVEILIASIKHIKLNVNLSRYYASCFRYTAIGIMPFSGKAVIYHRVCVSPPAGGQSWCRALKIVILRRLKGGFVPILILTKPLIIIIILSYWIDCHI